MGRRRVGRVAAPDDAAGDVLRFRGGGEGDEGDLGDLGPWYPKAVSESRMASGYSIRVHVSTRIDSIARGSSVFWRTVMLPGAPDFPAARTAGRPKWAETARRRIVPVAPADRKRGTVRRASTTTGQAPWAEPAETLRRRGATMAGAPPGAVTVDAAAFNPRTSAQRHDKPQLPGPCTSTIVSLRSMGARSSISASSGAFSSRNLEAIASSWRKWLIVIPRRELPGVQGA